MGLTEIGTQIQVQSHSSKVSQSELLGLTLLTFFFQANISSHTVIIQILKVLTQELLSTNLITLESYTLTEPVYSKESQVVMM